MARRPRWRMILLTTVSKIPPIKLRTGGAGRRCQAHGEAGQRVAPFQRQRMNFTERTVSRWKPHTSNCSFAFSLARRLRFFSSRCARWAGQFCLVAPGVEAFEIRLALDHQVVRHVQEVGLHEFNFEVQQLQPWTSNGFQRLRHFQNEAKSLMTMACVLHRIGKASPSRVALTC